MESVSGYIPLWWSNWQRDMESTLVKLFLCIWGIEEDFGLLILVLFSRTVKAQLFGLWANFLVGVLKGMAFMSVLGAGVIVNKGVVWKCVDVEGGKGVRGLFGWELGVSVKSACLWVGEFGGLL